MKKHVADKHKNLEKELTKTEAVEHVSELHELHAVYTSNDRLRLLQNMLKDEVDVKAAITKYLQSTVPTRNRLAHVRVESEGFSRKLFDKDGKELTSEEMKKLRQELLEFQELFEQLSEQLKSPAPQD